ncbi:MAG: ATP-binding protein, partial [Solirubrobacteraceae bacterium]
LDELRLDPASNGVFGEGMGPLCVNNLLACSDERISFKDRDGRYLAVSAGWLTGTERRRLHAPGLKEQVIGRTDADVFGVADAGLSRLEDLRVMESGEPLLAEPEHERSEHGADVWRQTTKLPLRNEQGEIVGTWGVSRDVTANVESEAALRVSREQLAASEHMQRVLFEHNPQPMWVRDQGTLCVVAVNRAALAMYGYTRDEFLALTVTDLVPPEDAEPFLAALRRAEDESGHGLPVVVPWRHRCKDGTVLAVELTSTDVMLGGRACRIASSKDVTARNRAAAELSAARDAAVEASNTKSAFLATISHEIRTPMNGVLGMTELLLDSDLDEDQRSLATQVSHSGELMVELIDDILDISKIEAGRLELAISDFPLRETIEQTCAPVRLRADAKGVELDVRIADDVPEHARGDGRRVRQVLLNLVANAVKFTAAGSVVVRVSRVPRADGEGRIRIEVTDTGIGIEQTILETVFEPFTQADVSTTRIYGGTGLGLTIARELVELMSGTIGVESEPGAGSTFWIEIPLTLSLATNDGPGAGAADASAVAGPLWLTAPLVLVAEDSPVNQIVTARTLERCGCNVDVVSDGRQALAALAQRGYDAVLMDCEMLEMDGYDATAQLRRREHGTRHTPVIAMTAHAMAGDRARCLEAGMDDYISKPIRREHLIETLRRWIPPAGGASVDDARLAQRA